MCKESSPTVEALLENKREMFDGMRAYHQSEISHTNHALTLLTGVGGAAGTIAVAILFPDEPIENRHEIAWGLFVVVIALCAVVAAYASCKIIEDHDTYSHYGSEYMRTSKLLGFYDETRLNDVVSEAIKVTRPNEPSVGFGGGYRATLWTIIPYASVIVLLTLVFASTLD